MQREISALFASLVNIMLSHFLQAGVQCTDRRDANGSIYHRNNELTYKGTISVSQCCKTHTTICIFKHLLIYCTVTIPLLSP